MDRQDCFCPAVDRSAYSLRIHVKSLRFNIDKHRSGAGLHDHASGRDKRQGCCDDFITGTNAECPDGQP